MDETTLRTMFPRASDAFIRANMSIEPKTDILSGKRRMWSSEDVCKLKHYYETTPDSSFSIQKCADLLGRSFPAVARKASKLGLTQPARKASDSAKQNMSEMQTLVSKDPNVRIARSIRSKAWMATHKHPRGMEGKHKLNARIDRCWENVTCSVCGKVFECQKSAVRLFCSHRCGMIGRSTTRARKSKFTNGWATVGDVSFFYRSSWELCYAKYLELQRKCGEISKWEYEPRMFTFDKIKKGCVTYTPDFRVTYPDGREEYHEVKGWMDSKSRTKIRRMAKYYPDVVLVVRDSAWFRSSKILK